LESKAATIAEGVKKDGIAISAAHERTVKEIYDSARKSSTTISPDSTKLSEQLQIYNNELLPSLRDTKVCAGYIGRLPKTQFEIVTNVFRENQKPILFYVVFYGIVGFIMFKYTDALASAFQSMLRSSNQNQPILHRYNAFSL